MQIIIKLGIAFCNLIYSFHKLWPVKNQVLALSRQHDEPSTDVKMLMDEINREYPDVKTLMLYKMVPPGLVGKIKYIFHMLGPEMHALATSKVVVLEGYSITASILHHREDLKVVQLWHALGILKKFAFLAVGTEEGRNPELAKAMHMHENYDWILASSEFCRPFYAEAFGYTEDHVKVIPLPRTDLLKNEEYNEAKSAEILAKYPSLGNSGKKNLLYAPTFRVDGDVSDKLYELIDQIDFDKYNLIVKLHPIDKTEIKSDNVLICEEFTTIELFSVADAMISDYSSIIFEAAAAYLPVYLYTYDLHDYISNRGFCIDFMEDVPLEKYLNAAELMGAMDSDFSANDDAKHEEYEHQMQAFADKFIKPGENNTLELCRFIVSLID